MSDPGRSEYPYEEARPPGATPLDTGDRAAAERLAAALGEAWRGAPRGELPRGLRHLFVPDVRFSQPFAPPNVGYRGFERSYASLLALLPDLDIEVVGWSARGANLYVEFELSGTVGRKRLLLRSCDRFVLREGLVVERHAFIDLLPLIWAIAVRPLTWPRAVRGYLRLVR